MKYPLASSTWDDEEFAALNRVILDGNFKMGKSVFEFESDFSKYFGSKYAVMVNSGSSANLLMMQALKFSGYLRDEQNEILVPAVSWSTTYFPINQAGFKIIFVDIEGDSFNIDVKNVKKYINKRTAAILSVNLLGSPSDLIELQKICLEASIHLLEDNCESMGSKIGEKYSGTFGLMGSFSTFFSHHICTMEGGLIITDDLKIYDILLSLRAHGWIRELASKNTLFDKSGDDWEDSFKFILPGYNVRPLEMEGALGVTQLKKFDIFLENRINNAEYLKQRLELVNLPIKLQVSKFESSWFGFGFTVDPNFNLSRREIVKFLSNKNIESRPIVAGNFTRNPVIKMLDYEIKGSLTNSDFIHFQGFFIGNHHYKVTAELEYFISSILELSTK